MEKYIYEDVTELKTPVGYFFVTDGKVKIPFSIRKAHLMSLIKYMTIIIK